MTSGELAPDLDHKNRIIFCTIDMGAYERPCGCIADIVTSLTLLPPPDGTVDGADLAYLIGEWGPGPSDADIVTSATIAPPPDGVVDGADLAYLLGNWGECPAEQDEECECKEMLTAGLGPFENTHLGDLLEKLIETSDAELAETVAALLAEWLAE